AEPDVEDQPGADSPVVLAEKAKLVHARGVRAVRSERNGHGAGKVGPQVVFVVKGVDRVLGVGPAAAVKYVPAAELEQVLPYVSPDLLIDPIGSPFHLPPFGPAPCADPLYPQPRHPALPIGLLGPVGVLTREKAVQPLHV